MSIDYTSFQTGDSAQAGQSGAINKRWWLADKQDVAASTIKVVEMLTEYDTRRRSQYEISARLYGNIDLIGLSGMGLSNPQTSNAMRDRISYNVAQAVVDTITSKIAKNTPKPLFLTSGGDYKIQRRAKKLDKFVEGVFYENDAHDLNTQTFRDACVFGDGFTHVFAQNGRVKMERVAAGELSTDWLESLYGYPRQLHRTKSIDRDVLIDAFPQHKAKIKECARATGDTAGSFQTISDQLTVVESWRLPSGRMAKDGKHTINISSANLLIEGYTNNFFPFARMPWDRRLYGYFSQGLVEQIQNIQLEINKILWIIQRSMHLAGSFKVFLEKGSKIVKEHLSNDIGALIMYSGQPPTYMVPPVVPVEYYQHLQTLKAAAFEQAGVSMLSAAAQKPAGLNSGKALREYNDIESDRFQTVGQAYEKLHLDQARLVVSVGREIYENDHKFSVQVPGKKFIESINWKDVDLEDDQYILKLYPISSLPTDPEGRLATVQEYAQAGYLGPRTARKLLDFPDLEQIEELGTSQEEYLHMVLEDIIEKGVEGYKAPDTYDDLDLAKELALQYYAQGKQHGLEVEKLTLLEDYMKQVDALTEKAQAEAMAKQQAQAMEQQAQQQAQLPAPGQQ